MSAPPLMEGDHKEVNDGLSHLTGTVGGMLENIGKSSSNLQNTLNNVYDLYSRAISERELLIKDISKIVEGSSEATRKLAAAEEGKTAAEQLKSQAEEAKRLADDQYARLNQQFQELQSSQQTLQTQHSALQTQHSALNQLHTEQLAVIRTHIGTINTLKHELKTLEVNLQKLRSQSTAYDCIKLYEKVPLLIKLKRTFDANVQQVTDPVTINSLKQLSNSFFQTEIGKLNQLVENLNTIISSYKQANLQPQSNHWENSIDRINQLKQKISENAYNTNLTFGDYVVFKWIVEKFPNVQVEQELKSKIDQITQQLRQ